jgi:hypothetical protein
MGLFSRKRPGTEEEPAGEELDEADEPVAEAEGSDPEVEPVEVDEEEIEVETEVVDVDPVDVEPVDPGPAPITSDDEDAGDGDGAPAGEGDGSEGPGQVEFELGDWGARERQLLDSELAAARVRRAWEAGTLVVAASDADVVDDLIDYIEERIALDLPSGVETVIYEVKDWPPGLEERFLEMLIDTRTAHDRGYQEIKVAVDDEERVDEIVEQITAAWEEEQPTDEELDGPDAQEVLSELFVSSDRLLHDPSDRVATVRFDDAAETAGAMALPFGFDELGWAAITDLAGDLREKLAEAESTDEEIVEAATALRSHLRPLV